MPRMEADFDWTGVSASTPIYPKGDYEVSVVGVRGRAWPKRDQNNIPTGVITQVVSCRVKMVGFYGSDKKLKSVGPDGKEIKGESVEDINLWMHSDGGRKMAKQQMMAIAGYNHNDPNDEKKFNAFLKSSELNLSFNAEENEAGDGYVLNIGDGWATLLDGKNVRASLDQSTRAVEGKEDILQQEYKRLSPVN